MRTAGLVLAAVPVVASLASCDADPVHTSDVNALPPEAAGVPQGPYHRAGQPCVLCHGDEGPASQQFAMAGTVFYGPGATSPLVGVGNAQVLLEDDTHSQVTTTTNCVGNFWIKPGDWAGHPQYPVIVRVVGQPQQTMFDVPMQSHISRQGSCAGCHQIPASDNLFETPGVIHLAPQDDPTFAGDTTCPVSPALVGN
jgi:hypothetical protein